MGSTYLEGFAVSELTRVSEQGQSPFDALRSVDDQGEYWSAREIMKPLGYSRWEYFEKAVERASAILACEDRDPAVDLRVAPKLVENGLGLSREIADYRLTRNGAYAVIQCGDARKPEIATAWRYFRQTVMRAEQGSVPTDAVPAAIPAGDVVALLRSVAEFALIAADAREQLELPRARGMATAEDWLTVRDWAKGKNISVRDYAAIGNNADRKLQIHGIEPRMAVTGMGTYARAYPRWILDKAAWGWK